MKKIFQILFLLPFTFFTVNFYSQNVETQNLINTPNISSPNISGLMSSVEVPVSNYNGTTNFNVPLFNLKEGDINHNISINYYSNGLKVEQEATNIGLGWNLIAGGVIERINNGDGFSSPYTINPYGVQLENLSYTYNDLYTNIPQRTCTFFNDEGEIYTLSYEETQDLFGGLQSKGFKYLLFRYSFGNYSGKFIRDRSGNFITIDRSDIRFEKLPNDGGYKATTIDGTVYQFTLNGFSMDSTSFIRSSDTFYLTKVTSPTNHEMNFSYAENNPIPIPHISQRVTAKSSDASDFSGNLFSSVSTSSIKEYDLVEINTENIKVKFNYGTRLDIQNGRKLLNIQVFNQGETLSKKIFNFNYTYFLGNLGFGDYTSTVNLGSYNGGPPPMSTDVKSKRLKLLSVTFSDEISNIDNNNKSFSYEFEYNTAPVPYKTSFAQDIWGYFNGYNNPNLLPNLNTLGYYDVLFPPFFDNSNSTASRKAREEYAKAGVLSKIIYPTKGFTEIEYEANEFVPYATNTSTYQLVKASVYDVGSTNEKSLEFYISEEHPAVKLSYQILCSIAGGPCDNGVSSSPVECPDYYYYPASNVHPNDNRLYIILQKKVGSNWEMVHEYNRTSPEVIQYATQNNFCGLLKTSALTEGQYRIIVNYPDNKTGVLGGPWASAEIEYMKEVPATSYENKGAGLRVKSIKSYSADNKIAEQKHFQYKNGIMITKPIFWRFMEGIERNQLIMYPPYPFSTPPNCDSTAESFTELCPEGFSNNTESSLGYTAKTILQSDATQPFSYNANGSLIGYSEVTIFTGSIDISTSNPSGEIKYKNGKEVYNYKNKADKILYFESIIPGIPGAMAIDNGLLEKKSIYKIMNPGSANSILFPTYKETYEYKVEDFRNYWAFIFDDLNRWLTCSEVNSTGYYNKLRAIHFYPIKVGKVLLDKKKVTAYNSNEGIPIEGVITETNYNYNSRHLLSKEFTSNSVGEQISMEYDYPEDLLNEPCINKLIAQNRIAIPIQKTTKKDGGILAQEKTEFQCPDDGLTLPKNIFTKKENYDFEKKVTYDMYDDKGNLLQYTVTNNVPICFIWGYSKQFPIAKIEGATYTQIEGYVAALQIASNNGTLVSESFNALRDGLDAALITTYTYEPLVGVTSITSPNKLVQYYEYDNLGRLKYTKDKEGNIISEHKYNYKN
ncbi:hypothetical protein CJ739_1211 [Mariniflexile rhizosphaerae]|uniref:hypothetical protein n=1 Tax=unclassified Mariniflexile TaxID=2643887 RepID=UPI000CAFF658|nr:hypothetical protein [Mariniflexile sp. TRM1-10]AXP80302.1 hypothetical protein CJ739_1211 [Mariniflexile sp. TRM1-10]PLB20678.1 MAG: YD repeat protein [Flavobacteriaceae bacterium FS1-H7996/R]